jgi:N-acetylglutamate synthase-like GNAT family acetyltransferase
VVRTAREQDYSKLDSMFKKYAPSDQDRYLYRILERIEPNAIRLATYGGQIVGCAYGHDHGEGIGIVAGLFLTRNFRNAENVEGLLRGCVQRLRDKGCSDIISMVSQEESLSGSYDKLGFKEWQRRVWTFVELPESSVGQVGVSLQPSLGVDQCRKVVALLGEQDLIPSRFWYRRVSEQLIRDMCAAERIVMDESEGSISVAVWDDLSSLRIERSRPASYFLFDKACSDLSDIGTSVKIREISLARGPKAEHLVRGIMNDAYADGIRTIMLHSGAGDASYLQGMNVRFSSPRIVLRSSLAFSLDSYLTAAKPVAM